MSVQRLATLKFLGLKLKDVKHLIITRRLATLKKKGSSEFWLAMMLDSLPCCRTICKAKHRKRFEIRVQGYPDIYSTRIFMPVYLSTELLFLTRWVIFKSLPRLITLKTKRFMASKKLILLQRIINARFELFRDNLELNKFGYKAAESDCLFVSALDTKTTASIVGMSYIYKRRARNQRMNNLYIQRFDGQYLNFNIWVRRK